MKNELDFYGIYLPFNKDAKTIPLEEVESVDSIVQRFKTGAMSYGSLSQEAHETLSYCNESFRWKK